MVVWPKEAVLRLDRIITLFIVLGLALTTISWLQICSESCAVVHFYKFFGYDFELLGFLFFSALLISHLFFSKALTAFLVVGGLGSELNFVLVQKFVIEQWCPVCLTIASSVTIIALLLLIRFFYSTIFLDLSTNGRKIMKSVFKAVMTAVIFVIGFIVAYVGVFKPEKSFADGINDKEVPYFGNADSQVEVFIITDWFCPACRAAEPTIDPLYARIMKKARLYFIDYPVHPESMNYVPYNMSFMIKDKDQYFKIRKALGRLSKTSKSPSQREVEEAVKMYNVSYKPMDYADVNEGIKFMEGIVKTFKVKQTPTIVIANRGQLSARKLSGSDITPDKIISAIDQMEKASK